MFIPHSVPLPTSVTSALTLLRVSILPAKRERERKKETRRRGQLRSSYVDSLLPPFPPQTQTTTRRLTRVDLLSVPHHSNRLLLVDRSVEDFATGDGEVLLPWDVDLEDFLNGCFSVDLELDDGRKKVLSSRDDLFDESVDDVLEEDGDLGYGGGTDDLTICFDGEGDDGG